MIILYLSMLNNKLTVILDNEINQKVVRRVLLHLGHSNVMMAINGMEALEMIARNGMPDLILMDVQMYHIIN